MSNYEQMQERLTAMGVKRRMWLDGFIQGLAYTQAQDPTVDDRPIKVDFPQDAHFSLTDKAGPITVQQFVDVWHDLDDEGGILDIRFTAEKYKHPEWGTPDDAKTYLKINLASTEGHRGIPRTWTDSADAVSGQFWITNLEEAQRVLDQSRQ